MPAGRTGSPDPYRGVSEPGPNGSGPSSLTLAVSRQQGMPELVGCSCTKRW